MHKDQLENAIFLIKAYLLDLQNRICQMLEGEDGKSLFIEDVWQHEAGGGGVSKVLADGDVIEKAGVNFSHVHGAALPQAATTKRPELAQQSFQALGVSVVIHPQNPFVPTTHMNVRFVAVEKTDGSFQWWFGGGFEHWPFGYCSRLGRGQFRHRRGFCGDGGRGLLGRFGLEKGGQPGKRIFLFLLGRFWRGRQMNRGGRFEFGHGRGFAFGGRRCFWLGGGRGFGRRGLGGGF